MAFFPLRCYYGERKVHGFTKGKESSPGPIVRIIIGRRGLFRLGSVRHVRSKKLAEGASPARHRIYFSPPAAAQLKGIFGERDQIHSKRSSTRRERREEVCWVYRNEYSARPTPQHEPPSLNVRIKRSEVES